MSKKSKYEHPVFDWSDVKKRGLENLIDMTETERQDWRSSVTLYRLAAPPLWMTYLLVAITIGAVIYAYTSSWIPTLELGSLVEGLMTASVVAAISTGGFMWMMHVTSGAIDMLTGKYAAEQAFNVYHDRMAKSYTVEVIEAEEIEAAAPPRPAEALKKKLDVINREWISALDAGREVDTAYWRSVMEKVCENDRAETKKRMNAKRDKDLLDD